MSNFKQKQYKSKGEKEFLFQHPGVRSVSKIHDAIKNKHGVVSEERLSEEILKHVIVKPQMKIDDFESYQEYNEVINAAYAFITGQDEGNDNQQAGS
ncbi:hypothetical protein [Paenibacillus sp. RC84]|uniref:hypothetical protein n=1 Tax=Paenibacillus sp. RC84 TaxID=3156252 RepID=UPI0035158D97